MKNILMASAAVLLLAACSPLTDQDREMITNANATSEAAKKQAEEAANDAAEARVAAEISAKAAREASEKADRIFRQGSNK